MRRSGLPFAGAMAVVLALALVGCSEPEPEEVIRAGRVPPGDTWCRLLDDDQLQMLLGDVDRERVRQVEDVNPRGGTSQRCLVVWADGDVPVWVATVWAWSRPGGKGFLDEVTRMRGLFGEDGERLASGEVSEVLPGVYYIESDGTLIAHEACDAGADELPELLSGALYMTPTESGRLPTAEEIEEMGEDLADLAAWAYECSGEVTPLGPEDWQPLADLYFERRDAHSAG